MSKKVPELRFPEFENGWKEITFGKLGDFLGGGTPSTKNEHYWIGETPWISSSDLTDENIHSLNLWRFITKDAISDSATKIIPKGSILVVSRVGVGKVAIAPCDLCTSQDFTNIVLKKDNNFFIANLIKIKTNRLLEFNQGTSIKGFVKSDLYDLKSFIPENNEQNKIASFLSSIDSKIYILTKKKELMEQYKKGIMQKIFSQEIRFKDDDGKNYPNWEEKKLDDVLLSFRLGGNYSNTLENTGFPLIKMGNISRGKINLEKIEYIASNENISDVDMIQKNDLFFNTRNTLELVGKVAIWREELPIAYYNSNLMCMTFDCNLFMNYYFNSYYGLKELKALATGTTSVAAIYTKDLLKIKFYYPILGEQKKISSFISSIDSKISQIDKELSSVQKFKKGLLQKMFV